MEQSAATTARSAQRVVETVQANGAKFIFGIPGAKVDGIYDALVDGGPELVICRHEQNAAFMAAAVGRLTGVPGVVLVTSGPGTTNIATGLLTATTEQDPVVAIAGAVRLSDRLKRTHQSMNAAALLGTVTKSTVESTHPDDVAEAVTNAFRSATTEPKGAAAVIIPADVGTALTDKSIPRAAIVPTLGPARAGDIELAAELLRSAERPVLLVGLRGADEATTVVIRSILEHTELPIVETFQAAGVVSRELEGHFLGRVGLFKNQPGDVALTESDLVLAIGYDAIEYDPVIWNTAPGARIVHLDSVPVSYDNHYQPHLELRGDIPATLDELLCLVPSLALSPEWSARLAELRGRLADIDARAREAEAAPGTVDPAALVLRMRDVLGDDATVACDIGSNYIYMARHFRTYEPRHLLFSNGQQTLGVALPWAMAACLVRPGTPVVSVSGDGGFLFSATEIETAQRLGLSFTHVIMRDNTYDMVGFQQVLKYGRPSGVQLGDYDVAHFAAAFGATGRRVSTLDEFETALRESMAEDGVSIIDVTVDYSHNLDLAADLTEDAVE